MSALIILNQHYWIVYILLFLLPYILIKLPIWRRLMPEVDHRSFNDSFILFTCFLYILLFIFILIFFMLPQGMGSSNFIKLLFFGGLIILPLNQLLFIVIYLLSNRNNTKIPEQPGRSKVLRFLSISLMSVGLVSLVAAFDMYFIEPYWIETNVFELECPLVKEETGCITLIQLSDTHFEKNWIKGFRTITNNIKRVIRKHKPDLIMMTGDYLHDDDFNKYREFFKEISGEAPIFGVHGNFYKNDDILFKDISNIHIIKDDYVAMDVRSTETAIIGLRYYNFDSFGTLLSQVPDNAVKILLCHTPDVSLSENLQQVDLTLTGHTHGGQVCLPFMGAIITLTKLGPAYASGLFRSQGSWLYVNKGLGCEPGNIPKIRFFCRPEIAVFRLIPEKKDIGETEKNLKQLGY